MGRYGAEDSLELGKEEEVHGESALLFVWEDMGAEGGLEVGVKDAVHSDSMNIA